MGLGDFQSEIKIKLNTKNLLFPIDDAEKFTSEMHDPCARSRYLQKKTKQEHLTEGTGVEPAKHPPKVKSEIFLQLQSAREESVTRTFM